MPVYGFMTMETLERTLARYAGYRSPLTGGPPRVVVAGGGEPTMHPQIVEMLNAVKAAGFHVTLITNAGRIDRIDCEAIVDRVDQVLVSFWGIEPSEYRASMRLDFTRSLRNVRRLRDAASKRDKPLAIQWLRTEFLTSDAAAVHAFWRGEGIDDVRGGDVVWNRAGALEVSGERLTRSEALAPDFARPVWCADLYLSDAYAWNGDLKLCCCSYFSALSRSILEGQDFELADIDRVKTGILKDAGRPECRGCRLPRRSRARQLLGPYAQAVSQEHLNQLEYPPEQRHSSVHASEGGDRFDLDHPVRVRERRDLDER